MLNRSAMDSDSSILLLNIMQNDFQAQLRQNMFFQWWLQRCENDDVYTHVTLTSKIPRMRIPNNYEEWLPYYLDNDFFCLFRMTKATFEKLLSALNCYEKEYTGGETPISVEKAVLMTIWWLGKGEVLLSVADKFNVTVSTVFNCTQFILQRIVGLRKRYIVWPDRAEVEKIQNDFKNRSGFPGVIGAVDVCNIKFKAPAEHQESYIDKNRNHSIKLQGIATCDKIFTNIMVGYPGSAHDSRVFKNSRVYFDIEENGLSENYLYGNDYHLIGDKAYPLKTWIMTPYKDNGNLIQRQRHYNTCHSITRIVIEHTFGLLKSRWRILNYINVNSVPKAVYIITACCVLHNFCFINCDFWDSYENVNHDNDVYNIGDAVPNAALQKRFRICNVLWEEHQ